MAFTTLQPNSVNTTANFTFNAVTVSSNVTANIIRANGIYYSNGAPFNGQPAGSNTQVQFNDNGVLGAYANFLFNKTTATLSAPYYFGDGSNLTNLTGAQIIGKVANAIYSDDGALANVANTATKAGTVTTNAQPNITSVGTLTILNVTGNITGGNVNGGNLVVANYISGDGSLLTSLNASNISSGTLSSARLSGSYSISVTSATTAGTVTTNAQPNITSVGTLSSLTVTGNVTANYLIGNGSQLTGLPAGYSNANVAAYLPTYTGNFSAGNVTVTTSITTLNATVTGTLTAGSGSGGNITGANLISANYISGNGSLLTSINGSNVTGQVSNSLIAGTVYTAAQPNITSVGTLTSLSVTGNVTASYFIGNGSQLTGLPASYSNTNVAAYLPTYTGNVAAAYFIGNGSQLTGLPASYSNTNVAAYLPTYTGNVNANYFIGNGSRLTSINGSNVSGTVSAATTAGTVTTNAQPNITSVGTLSSLTVTGNVTTGNVSGTLLTGTLSTAAQPNITSVGTLSSLTVTGNVTTGNVSGTLLTGTLSTAAQPNITSVGTLTSLTVDGLASLLSVTQPIGSPSGSTYDFNTATVFYVSSLGSNFTPAFTNVPTTDNRATIMLIIINQGATPYVPSGCSINGSATTVKWNGGNAPTGTASSIEYFSFTLIRTGSSWIVTGQSGAYY